MRVKVLGDPDEPWRATLNECVGRAQVSSHADGDCLLLWEQKITDAISTIEADSGLRWVHTRNAGIPTPLLEACEQRGLTLTNGSGAHANAVGEYVACAVLSLFKRMPDLAAAQRTRSWRPEIAVRELRGRTAGIIGLGQVGRACARMLKPFGVELIGFSRSGTVVPEVDVVHSSDELSSVLPSLDVLIIAAPLTASTYGLIGRAELALLPPTAVVVNVGRGEVLDEGALVAALDGGTIAGAALDVFTVEPLPPDSPLWTAPNLIISPHSIDETPETTERGLRIFCDNLDRWIRREPLSNVVRANLGY